ncbi:amidase [Reyranella soli]|uniref:amidase n=1 Tax=Reyranella soli TaxID=1230389 RepID=UPI002810B660|nr:amidase family protein [Reyranella soli]
MSPLELVDAAIARIAEVEPAVNALPILCFDRARDQAKRMMREGAAALERPLAGLPIAVKDLSRLQGVRTTWGSPIFSDHVADRSDIGVETLERNGAIPVAKSNVPELGIGANTTNPLFGATRNPWNTDLTPGGSSGGAAVSVATGEVWLAGGSDGGCSLRVPASFCSVATLRPTPGRIASGTTSPVGPRYALWETLAVEGTIGRTVGDVALMFQAQVGAHPLDPRSMPADGTSFLAAVVEANRDRVKRDMIWNIERGKALTSGVIAEAERRRADIVRRMAAFFERYDFLLCPAACTPPFDVNWPALMELEGHRFEHYYDWYTICFVISLTANPAMSVPCGFTREGLPVGLQIIGPHRGEAGLLSTGRLVEEMAGISSRVPIDPRGPARSAPVVQPSTQAAS